MNTKSSLILLVLGILTTVTIVQAGNFNFDMNVEPAVLFLAPGEQGVFTITFTDTSVPPTGGDVIWSITHDGSHNIYGVSGEPNPVAVPAGGVAIATWTVAAEPDAAPGTIIHVTFQGDPPGIIMNAYANIEIVSPSTNVNGSSLNIVGMIIMATFLIIISISILKKGR